MHADSWAIKAKQLGLRSRAVFKLEEILQKTKVLKQGSNIVLDIGSAPGGWSELIKSLSPKAQIFAIDLLEMEPIGGVNFFQEDIENINSINEIFLLKNKFDLVISDLAPNLSGIRAVDEENIFELNLLTLETASSYLKEDDGYFIMKTFQNSSLKKLRLTMEKSFRLVQTYKPAASKSKSGEIYLYGAKPL
ncbi:MAG: RlmE family RNA methyltransferase [SAR86 cluster bacterium]|nr:RlmE family RNA methyltransferase [SAR86 cluster bacterium]